MIKSNNIPSSVIFPYADDLHQKQQQLWDNLQQGLLFEGQRVFLPWETSYKGLSKLAVKKIKQSDRTIWWLGERVILGGLQSRLHILQWFDVSGSAKINKVTGNLGQDYEGYHRFQEAEQHLVKMFGKPHSKEMEPAGPMELGAVEWTHNNICIRLSGIEIFTFRYSLNIYQANASTKSF